MAKLDYKKARRSPDIMVNDEPFSMLVNYRELLVSGRTFYRARTDTSI